MRFLLDSLCNSLSYLLSLSVSPETVLPALSARPCPRTERLEAEVLVSEPGTSSFLGSVVFEAFSSPSAEDGAVSWETREWEVRTPRRGISGVLSSVCGFPADELASRGS